MSAWKTKLFGDNRMNFYGWISAVLLVGAFSIWLVLKALRAGASHSPEGLLLLAIYVVLLGHFGIAAQNYCARVAKALESEEAQENESQATQQGGST